jgi:PAS domain S-box-containing protein
MQQIEAESIMRGAQVSDGQEDTSVLIVNDLPEQLMLMAALLRKAGYGVLTAEDGIEAYALAKREQPDLVISDVCMPRADGLTFCRLLRADKELCSVPILLVSARETDTANVLAGLRAGADDYLEIPFDPSHLIAKVSRLLERYRIEANYRDLVEQTSDLIFTHDLEGRLTSINAAGVKFLGRKSEELLGQPFSSIFGLVGVNLNTNTFSDNGDHDEPSHEFRHQFVAKRAPGEARWLDLTISPIRNKLKIVGFRGIARDVTQRKQTEFALRDSEERYRLLFESTPQPIWVYDTETLRFLTVNEAAVRTYGYSRDEFLAMTTNDLGLEDEAGSRIHRHHTKTNKTIYVEISSHPVFFDGRNGELVIINDITQRKALDEKQRHLHDSLEQSAIEWRQTFDAIDFPVLIVDLEGAIKRSNLAAEQAAGGPMSLVGQNVADLRERQPWKKAIELMQGIHETSIPLSEEIKDESTGKTWAVTVFVVKEFAATADRAILIAQDVTNRMELESSLRQSKIMSLLGSVAAGVAHEVRNPLFGISSILDAFETRFGDRAEYSRYTKVLRDEVGRLTLLMEELLEYGKPMGTEFHPASMEEIINKSIRACRPAANSAHVTLVNKIRESLPPVMADRHRLSTVLINIMENAIQHSPPHGVVTIETYIVTEGDQKWICSEVKDLGQGIPHENLSKIFEPFFSTRRGGTGLGLAIAQKTVEEHGGRLLAENNPEGGTRMTALFPVHTEVNGGG